MVTLGVILVVVFVVAGLVGLRAMRGHAVAAAALCGIGAFAGIVLIFLGSGSSLQTLTEISTLQQGVQDAEVLAVARDRLDALLKQAEENAAEISSLRENIASKNEAVEKVANDAEELLRRIEVADKQRKQLEVTLQQATDELSRLQLITGFNMTVLAARHGDQEAVERLTSWAESEGHPLKTYAEHAMEEIRQE